MTFKSELVFVRILLPTCAGIWSAYIFQDSKIISWSLMVSLLIFVILIPVNIFYNKLEIYQYKWAIGLLFFIFWYSFGCYICIKNIGLLEPNYYGKRVYPYLKVWISNEPQQNNGIIRIEAEVIQGFLANHTVKTSGKILIALNTDTLKPVQLDYGDELLISTTYFPVEPSYNPSEFDFQAWLASKNIFHQTFLLQNQYVQLSAKMGNPIIKYAISVRKRQVDCYRKLIRNDEAFAVASTLVLGYRADLSKETLSAYSKTGTIHALSVSGMHVGIIYIFLNWALFFLNRNTVFKIVKLFLICSLIWYYSLLTGFSPSVLRSAIMLTVYILAKAFNRNSNSYNILAFTAFCLLIYNPLFIWDVGFQLSFLAVFGLVYLQPKIYKWFYFKSKWLDKLWATIALSLAAQIATFPLSIYYFHQFPIYFIFSNLFILLPLTAMMYLGIGILMLRLYFLAPIFEWIINFTNTGLKWIANLPFSGITAIWINQWQLVLLSLFLLTITLALTHYHKKLFITSIVLILFFQTIAAFFKTIQLKQNKIISFNLRKNYAVAFIDGLHAVLLTDLKPSDKNFDFFVKPALDQLQINKIDFINWETDTTINLFNKKEHQLIFHQYHILLMDQSFNFKKIAMKPKFNMLWMHQNPKQNIAALKDQVQFSTLLIDATNKDYLIKKFEAEANKIALQHYSLKKNKAYLIDLK
jgi:competence protein ComEC